MKSTCTATTFFDEKIHGQTDTPSWLATLRENGRKPVRISQRGRIFIGRDEFMQPVIDGSISARRLAAGRTHLTLTLLVGDVTFETDKSPVD